MRGKFASLFAALLLVAACETTPEESASTAGAGAATQPTGGTEVTTAAVTPPPVETAAVAPAMPAGPAPGTQEDLVVNVGDRVFFDYDKSVIAAQAQTTLRRQADWMRLNPDTTVTIEGHADERGTREYNLALGERRAMAVRNYLVALGVDPNRLATISYGKERPALVGHNEAAWSQNRRGVSVVN